VVNNVEYIEDIACLGATCHALWVHCAPRIEFWAQSNDHTWASTRIACLGDYADDMPVGALSSAEKVAINSSGCYSFYGYAKEIHKEINIGRRPRRSYSSGFRIPLRELIADFAQARSFWCAACRARAHGRAREARGLAQLYQEDIRARLGSRGNQQKNPGTLQVTLWKRRKYHEYFVLGDALVSRICWSSDPSCAMSNYPHDLTRGPWAFDMLDITKKKEFEEMSDFAEWKDTSEAVCEAMYKCYEN
jgi:hypothetical protein